MRIRTNQLIEDSNRFTLAQLGDHPHLTPYTVPDSFREVRLDGELVGVARVDRIPKDVELDLPDRQALRLIELNYAEAVA